MFDVIVIGGGPSGLMASASAGMHGAKVLLLDKGNKLGRKLAISGGGRCNVTNNKNLDELITFIPGNGRFLHSVFATFNNQDIIRFFEDLGIALKEEDNGRMFPVSNSAKDVVQALLQKVRSEQVQIRTDTAVKTVRYRDGKVIGVEAINGEYWKCKSVVIATGGKSVPHTGSTGDGYAWAEAAGHTITELFPTEVPITSNDPIIQSKVLQGLSLRDVSLSVRNPKGKAVISHRGDMIFTHFGLSGPIALRCSQFVIKQQNKTGNTNVIVQIDLFPDQSLQVLEQDLQKMRKNHPKRSIHNLLKGLIPERLIPVILQKTEIETNTLAATISNNQVTKIADICKQFTIQVSGTLPLEKAFVTGGGVHIKEVNPKTMGSKLMNGLYFCGEVLDIHGYTGGYNITAALCTGYVAGKHAAKR
ncbi:NAD(P)/FAD-dependent oxidoreductase [Shimazuella alba]|uniref:Aminoacetone oxidase family FAD-binding enzyme n=1 Tax=Shimazuella alba TaxID=2690964 RepID=A0A6I4W0W2_9BACL|nr:NAD(P)/FAD-dependent oxidoreductase [Shimazuella alba]MXQ54324.1 aminoacetone oxidase family FAD-binding enzyme [Shimazuella alba]